MMGISHDLLAVCIADAAIIAIGIGAWRRNHSAGAGRMFFIAMLAFGFWLTTNYFSLQEYDVNMVEWLTRINYVAGFWLMLCAWYFCYQFPVERKPTYVVKLIAAVGFVIGTAFSYSPLVVDRVEPDGDTFLIKSGMGYVLYGVLLIGLAGAAIAGLRRNYAVSDLLKRNQIRYVAFGITVSATISISFNVWLVPILGPQWGSPLMNLLVTFPIVVFLGYGLIRNRYMDIHRVMSLLVTYLVCLILAANWLILARLLLDRAYPDSELYREIGMTLAAAVAVFALQPVQRGVRLYTDRLFSVNWYDSQVLLNDMGALLAGELRLSALLKNSLDRLCTELKLTAAELIILNGDKTTIERFGEVTNDGEALDISKLPPGRSILLADELPAGHPLIAEFERTGVRAAVPLETRGRQVGYLLLGIKQHGDIFSPQDIGVLRILANQLAVAVVSALAYEQIRDFNGTLQEQIAQATGDLQQAHEKLQLSDRMKTEFIILTSHNLRTPLSVVKGYIDLLEDTNLDESQRQLLASMKTGSERLSEFTEDLLAIDSIVGGQQLVLEPTSVEDILQPLFKEAMETSGERGIQFIPKTDIEGVVINANQLRLSGAIRNLLDNAFKFTEKGHVILEAQQVVGKLRITVTDTGIGIPAEELPNLFTQFHRATDTLQYDYEGEGIGLYLTNLVVKEHGGTITVVSEPGRGSEFTVTLPIASAPS